MNGINHFQGGFGESCGGTGAIPNEPDDMAGTLGVACSLVEEAGKQEKPQEMPKSVENGQKVL